MYTPTSSATAALLRQRGVTLIISVILLLLLSVIVLLATNVGLQEQRTSGNDYRAKLAHHAAEAALNFGGEYFKQNANNLRNPGFWTACAANDTNFPCGVLLAPNGSPQPGTMRYTGNIPLGNSVPLAAPFTDPDNDGIRDTLVVGGFTATVQVGAVMCRVPPGSTPPASACTTNAGAPGSSVVSVVARGQIAGEQSSTTLVQSITESSKLNISDNVPPIAAAGTVDVTGALDIVTNPNAAGPGVPVSVWTRKDVAKVGSPNTCYLDEFVRFGAQGSATPVFCDSTHPAEGGCSELNTKIILCDDCRCPTDDNGLSFHKAGNVCGEDIDILDIDAAGEECGPNENVLPPEFPCDLFEFVFGVRSHTDTNPVDNFCETLITAADPDNPGGPPVGVDELYLRENANIIIVATPDTNRDSRERGCAFLTGATGPSARGLIWAKIDCNVGGQVGGPENPVVLVVDGAARFSANFRLFGILFVRALVDPLDVITGGDATLRFNGHGAIYGSAVVQGKITNLNGTAAFIYNETVLTNLVNESELRAFGTMPGSWTDRFSY